jgi:YidC/Oxa1 family membrane protein insertase
MEGDQKRAFAAVILSAIILFSWQFFFGNKTPAPAQNTEIQKNSNLGGAPVQVKSKMIAPSTEKEVQGITEKTVTIKNGNEEFALKNDLSIGSLDNTTSIYSFEDTIGEKWPVQILFKNKNGEILIPRFSQILQNGENSVQLTNGFLTFDFTMLEDGRVKVKASNLGENTLLFKFQAQEKDLGQGKLRSFIAYSNEIFKSEVGDDGQHDGLVRWAGIDFNYHLFALNFLNPNQATVRTTALNPNTQKSNMFIELGTNLNSIEFEFIYAKKNYDQLVSMGNGLQMSVDYGFFSIISIPIHKSLQFFYTYVKNYGLAIIILTILIRLITFPLQYKSIKSMKKMQVIQPELNKLKEKYKDNPQKMQQESMALFKRAGANPVSGCFPMLLQMPIFFAFYSVLRESIELVNAPFFGWIHDLSGKDPLYIIPVLMAAAMFLQQKLTPSPSTDPTQKKVMMLMPIVFGFFMLNLPSGLTLYILVSTLFGIGQQLLVFKKMS